MSKKRFSNNPSKPNKENSVLVVDLDGTLIRSDMLYETFWSSFSSDWRTPLFAAQALKVGIGSLKKRLFEKSSIDVGTLPYNEEVLEYIHQWRSLGGQTALVTASNQELANDIAEHLGIFDEVYGSNESRNIKGVNKAALLSEKFPDSEITYMGDSKADMPVWQQTSKSVTVNATRKLKTCVEALEQEFEHLTAHAPKGRAYFKAMRSHQWLKNVLVFIPMLAAHEFNATTFAQSFLAFVSFSLIASSVYLLNDLLDLSADRAHLRKCKRPIASGSLPIAHGTFLAPILFILGLSVALFLGSQFTLVMLGYFSVTTIYSLYLKRRTIIDICTLAGLYTMRLIAGGAATGISLSVWLLAFSIFFFFSLAAVKRQAELVDGAATGRMETLGRGYRVEDLPLITNMAVSSGYMSVLVFALYINSPVVQEIYINITPLWGICLVLLYWISRMIMITHRGKMHDDPIVYATTDRVSQICFLSMAILAGVATLA